MKKLLFIFLFGGGIANAQFVYPTDAVWDFLNGLQTNRINSSTSTRVGINVAPTVDFHVLADTVRFEGLDGSGSYLTIDGNGVITKGSVSITGLTASQVLYGAGDGTIAQSSNFTYGSTLSGIGLGLSLSNTDADPNSWTSLVMNSTNGQNYFAFEGDEESYTYYRDAGSTSTYWRVGRDAGLQTFNVQNITSDESFNVDAWKILLNEADGGTSTTYDANGWAMGARASITHPTADANTGLTVSLSNAGATGNILSLSNNSGVRTSFNTAGKINLYNGSAPTNGQLLIGNTAGGTFDAATLTAGQDITITNSGGSITVANTFNLDAGTYTPTVTAVTNIDAVTASGVFNYIRIGSIVKVSGFVDLDPTANGTTTFRVSLPAASDFTLPYDDCSGTAASEASVTQRSYIVTADTTNDEARVSGSINFTASQKTAIQFQYIIK